MVIYRACISHLSLHVPAPLLPCARGRTHRRGPRPSRLAAHYILSLLAHPFEPEGRVSRHSHVLHPAAHCVGRKTRRDVHRMGASAFFGSRASWAATREGGRLMAKRCRVAREARVGGDRVRRFGAAQPSRHDGLYSISWWSSQRRIY